MRTSPTTGVDTRDMLVVHDSIRRQFGQAPSLVRGVSPGETANLDALHGLFAGGIASR